MASLRSSVRHYRLFSTINSTATAAAAATTTSPLTSTLSPNLQSEPNPHKHLQIDPNVSDTAIKRLSLARQFADIEAVIESRKNDPRITDETYFSTLIRSYGVAGMLGQASALFSQMEKLGTPRTTISFNALLSAYNMGRQNSQVPKLFDEMTQKYDLKPNEFSYNIVIKSLLESNSVESALSKLEEMEKNDIEVTSVTYTTILDGLFKKGMVEEAEKMWDRMIEKGCPRSFGVYNARIAHAHLGKPQEVLRLFEDMEGDGVKPDTTSYNYLFTCYSKNGMVDEARKVYRDLERNGCVPNGASFRLHIHHLCKTGDFEKGYEVFEESMKVDRVPAFRILKTLVEGLVKISRKDLAKELIRKIKEKFPDNLSKAWNQIEVDLGLIENEEFSTKETSVDST